MISTTLGASSPLFFHCSFMSPAPGLGGQHHGSNPKKTRKHGHGQGKKEQVQVAGVKAKAMMDLENRQGFSGTFRWAKQKVSRSMRGWRGKGGDTLVFAW